MRVSQKTLPVLCCCNPDNEVGEFPDNLPYEKRRWVDDEGNSGLAYPSSGVPKDILLGKKRKKKKRPKKKGRPRKTWEKK